MNPTFSVCIPVYNGREFIEETIRSVLDQTETDFELLIQDNQSTDGTWEFLQTFAAVETRAKLARNDSNIGMAGNWNAGIDRAQGQYVLLLSADDLLKPEFLKTCLQTFRERACKVVSTELLFFEEGKTRRRRVRLAEGAYRNHAGLILLKNPFSINFTVFERNFLNSQRRFGKVFGPYITADYGLHLRVAMSGETVYFIGQPLGLYRFHANNLSRQARRMNRQAALTVLIYRAELLKICRIAFDFTLLRFILRALVQGIKSSIQRGPTQRAFDLRLIRLLVQRMK